MNDTSPEAEQVLRDLLRAMPLEKKWRSLKGFFRLATALAGRQSPMNGNAEQLEVVGHVVRVLNGLQIPHVLSGSMASSLYGKFRTTYDADICAEPFAGKEAAFCKALGDDYYSSQQAIEQAIRTSGSFNIIHLESGFKVDIFIAKPRLFDRSFLARRRLQTLPNLDSQPIHVVTAEDVLLLKMEWFRLGNEVSQTQWQDIINVFLIQGPNLDQAYLDQWAEVLNVKDLLDRARQESSS